MRMKMGDISGSKRVTRGGRTGGKGDQLVLEQVCRVGQRTPTERDRLEFFATLSLRLANLAVFIAPRLRHTGTGRCARSIPPQSARPPITRISSHFLLFSSAGIAHASTPACLFGATRSGNVTFTRRRGLVVCETLPD